MFKHILLATDGSAASDHAAQIAADMARIHGATLTALYVVDPYPYLGIGETNPLGFQSYMAAAQNQATQAHAKVADLCSQGDKPVTLQTRTSEDVTASVGIVDAATNEGADLIVMSTHKRKRLEDYLVGTNAMRVLQQSKVSVLVVR